MGMTTRFRREIVITGKTEMWLYQILVIFGFPRTFSSPFCPITLPPWMLFLDGPDQCRYIIFRMMSGRHTFSVLSNCAGGVQLLRGCVWGRMRQMFRAGRGCGGVWAFGSPFCCFSYGCFKNAKVFQKVTVRL